MMISDSVWRLEGVDECVAVAMTSTRFSNMMSFERERERERERGMCNVGSQMFFFF